jgi:perosamine synthetase
VFCDIDESMTIDPEKIPSLVSKKTKAVFAVDFSGSPCNYDALNKICTEHDIFLLLDGAHSLGSMYKNHSCLSYGHASTTSFHAAKILTTVEGGMIYTDDSDLAVTMKAIRSHGELDKKYIHELLGGNFRMTDLLAGFGIHQLKRYQGTLDKRKKMVELYQKRLRNVIDFFEVTRSQCTSNHFLFLVLTEQRDQLAEYLKNHGVDTRKHYPQTIPNQPVYQSTLSFPVAERFSRQALALPLFFGLIPEQIHYVCDQIEAFIAT